MTLSLSCTVSICRNREMKRDENEQLLCSCYLVAFHTSFSCINAHCARATGKSLFRKRLIIEQAKRDNGELQPWMEVVNK